MHGRTEGCLLTEISQPGPGHFRQPTHPNETRAAEPETEWAEQSRVSPTAQGTRGEAEHHLTLAADRTGEEVAGQQLSALGQPAFLPRRSTPSRASLRTGANFQIPRRMAMSVRPLLAALLLPALLLSNASAADSKSTAPSLCLQSFTFFSCCCLLLHLCWCLRAG
jgi:hypothetical protein